MVHSTLGTCDYHPQVKLSVWQQTLWHFNDVAIAMLAAMGAPPFKVYIDCQGTLDGFREGRPVVCAITNARAHLWGRFLAAFEGEEVQSL